VIISMDYNIGRTVIGLKCMGTMAHVHLDTIHDHSKLLVFFVVFFFTLMIITLHIVPCKFNRLKKKKLGISN